MKKITEVELSKRVNSLRERLVLEGGVALGGNGFTVDDQIKLNQQQGQQDETIAEQRVPDEFDGIDAQVAAMAANAQAAAPADQYGNYQPQSSSQTVTAPPYIVQKGDNLTVIAKKMGVTLQDLLKVNPQFQQKGRNINLIYPNEPVNRPPVAPFRKELSKTDKDAISVNTPQAATPPAAKPAPAPILPPPDIVNPSGKVQDAPAATQPTKRLTQNGTVDRAINPRKSYQESVTYADDQTLARIVSLGRR